MNMDVSKGKGLNTFYVLFNDVLVGKLNVDKTMRMCFIYGDAHMAQKAHQVCKFIPKSRV